MIKKIVNGKSMLAADETFNRARIEAWIIGELGNPPEITEGITTPKQRQERIRDLILKRGIANSPATAKTKQNWATVYARFYGELLTKPSETIPSKGKEHVAIT